MNWSETTFINKIVGYPPGNDNISSTNQPALLSRWFSFSKGGLVPWGYPVYNIYSSHHQDAISFLVGDPYWPSLATGRGRSSQDVKIFSKWHDIAVAGTWIMKQEWKTYFRLKDASPCPPWNQHGTWTWMVGRRSFPFGKGLISGAMLVLVRVYQALFFSFVQVVQICTKYFWYQD